MATHVLAQLQISCCAIEWQRGVRAVGYDGGAIVANGGGEVTCFESGVALR